MASLTDYTNKLYRFCAMQQCQATERGIRVAIILDKSQVRNNQYSSATFFANHHIPVWIDNTVSIAHNKVMVMDESTVITGSFNFTKAAQFHNAENVLILENPKLANMYLHNWYARRSVSEKISDNVYTVKKEEPKDNDSSSAVISTVNYYLKKLKTLQAYR